MMVDIITIDGPASSGKGTVAKIVAQKLGFNYLDSGAIYRSLAFLVLENHILATDIESIIFLIKNKMHLEFQGANVLLNNNDVTQSIRKEGIGNFASKLSQNSYIREILLDFQRGFAYDGIDGLVTDGRDMGSVVFKDATLKVFLTASVETRANRRLKQLQVSDKSAIITPILRDIIQRDKQDSSRESAPLTYDTTYKFLDNTTLTVNETVDQIISWYRSV